MKTKIIVAVIGALLITTGAVIRLMFLNSPQPASKTPTPKTSSVSQAAPHIRLTITEENLQLMADQKKLEVGIKSDNNEAIVRVEYLIDSHVVASTIDAPFNATIDVSQLGLGIHKLQARAYNADGNTSESEEFSFTINEDSSVEPGNEISRTILARSAGTGSSGGSQEQSGGNSGGTPTPIDTTPWPDTPPAQPCGTQPWNNGPVLVPAGAITVPVGDNSGFNFSQPNTTYWFASGTHTIGSGQFSQIAPGSGATFIGAPGAVLDGQGLNNHAFSGSATGVTIRYLTVINFNSPRDEGVVNHNSGVGWTFEYDNFHDNRGGAVFLGTNNVLRYSCLKDNGQYGFQVYSSDVGGPTNVLLDHNEITGNNTDDWESQVVGCGCTGGGKFWDAHSIDITNNYVHHNLSVGLWADTNDTDFLVDGNYISDNDGQGLFYEISYNMTVKNNNFVRNALVDGQQNGGFPTGAIYLSESGGDSRVAGRTHDIDIYDNQFTDNWAGVILWENADRYCASPNNTSSGTCTMVNPAATLTTCGDPAAGGSIDQEPYYSDCRWKTQNVKVHNNNFDLNKANVPNCSSFPSSCGLQGIFSNSGSSPTWSPYMGNVIQQAITFNQHNLFSNNTYIGDWHFMVKDQNTTANPPFWMASPYNQDIGSTFDGNPHPLTTNFLDDNTSTLEGSLGKWQDWFGETATQDGTQAHSGTKSLKVAVSGAFWGVQLSNAPGFPTFAGNKTASFWVKGSAANNSVASMEVTWAIKGGGSQTDTLPITNLSNNWQKVSADLVAPTDATNVYLVLRSGTGTVGDTIYLDDFVVSDRAG